MHALAEMPTTGPEWRELRDRRELSVPELSEITGLQPSTIHKLEAGASVNRSTRTLVGAALGLPVFGEPAKAMVA